MESSPIDAQSMGFSVRIMECLSEGFHGVVYAGALSQNGRVLATVAVKASDNIDGLVDQFSSYKKLKKLMGPHIPRCYGLCVSPLGRLSWDRSSS